MGIFNRLQVWGQWLTTDPVGFLVYLVYFAVAILATLIFHEVAHGYVAYRCGDPTAKMLGRLSLDPRKHLDPVGTVFMVLFGFGWAKPVPVNPRNFRSGVRDDLLVSLAGVTVNFTLFLLSMALAVGINGLLWQPVVISALGAKELISSRGAGYGALLTGQGGQLVEYMRTPWLQHEQRFLMLFFSLNLGVGVFNLLPIPPLDGWHVLDDVVFKGRLSLNRQVFQIAQFGLMALALTGALSGILLAITGTIENGVLSLFLRLAGHS